MSLLCFFGQSPCLLESHNPVSSQRSSDETNHVFLPGSPHGNVQTVHCTTGEQRFLMFLIRARGQFLLIEFHHETLHCLLLIPKQIKQYLQKGFHAQYQQFSSFKIVIKNKQKFTKTLSNFIHINETNNFRKN